MSTPETLERSQRRSAKEARGRGDGDRAAAGLVADQLDERRAVIWRMDLNRMITPMSSKVVTIDGIDVEIPDIPPLTPEEQKRGLAALEQARAAREELLKQRGGELFPPSWEALHEIREERSRQLG